MNARQLWEREVRAGLFGQDRQRPGTWVLDGLYLAAIHETNALELDAQGLHRAAADERRKADAKMAAMFDAAPDVAA